MVRHPAGLAAREQGQAAAPLTPEAARRRLSPEGRDAVAYASTLDLSAGARLQAAEAVRPLGPDLGPLALEQALLDDVALRAGTELIKTDDSDEVVDVVLLWWREDDGDLVDALVDSLTNLADHGVVWLLTPKAGRDGHVEPSDIDEAAPTAGLSSTRSTSAAPEWSGTRLVSPRASKGKQQRR